jgi:hypothetical protein
MRVRRSFFVLAFPCRPNMYIDSASIVGFAVYRGGSYGGSGGDIHQAGSSGLRTPRTPWRRTWV